MSSISSTPFEQAAQAGAALVQQFVTMVAARPEADAARQFAAWAGTSGRVTELQTGYQQKLAELWLTTLARQRGEPYRAVAEPDREDRRFAGAEWRDSPFHDYMKQSYLLGARLVTDVVEASEVEARAKHRLRFYARQFVDMMSPANFTATNPDVVRTAVATQGESLALGLRNLIADVEKRRITQTDETAFELGRNIAATPGAVVFENELIQVVQYAPSTPAVRARAFVMVPPCINKFYVLDLAPENSFVRWAVERGNTCFMVSWRNITAETGHLTWDDYIRDGVLKGLEVVRAVSGEERVNALGYCVGGTMLGAALAVLAARGERWVESVTFFTSLLDFGDVGDLAVFVDESGVRAIEESLAGGGVKEGRELAAVFNIMRANDLVWSYVVNSYLKGRQPDAFDILYWNADSTNLAGPWYCWYVRNTYLENNLRVPGKVATCGVPVDFGRIDAPTYVLAAREDHIVPWRGAYETTRLVGGRSRFVLGASGHIAGVINPAAKNRRSYWTNEQAPASAEDWLAGATEHKGSWWRDWDRWIAQYGGGDRPAPAELGNERYRPVEPAPGRYVRHRVV